MTIGTQMFSLSSKNAWINNRTLLIAYKFVMNIAGILYEQDMEARLERKKANLYSKQTLLVACFRRYVFYAFHGRFVRSITD
jgi:hypothetical protein